MTTQTPAEIFESKALEVYGRTRLSRPEIIALKDDHDVTIPGTVWKSRVARGIYECGQSAAQAIQQPIVTTPAPADLTQDNVTPISQAVSAEVHGDIKVVQKTAIAYIPANDPIYVPWGNHHTVKKVVRSGLFFPILITGLSGNGKTKLVKQICAETKREYIRANITSETDEDSLIGGFRLVNGESVWCDGPVMEAMQRGAVLLLDEIDKATDKIMMLQSILEGEPYLIKKTGRIVEPSPGFNIILTANTKGKGDSTGKFSTSRVLDEAMLDRIPMCIEQPYPNKATETKILTAAIDYFANNMGIKITDDDKQFIGKVIDWSAAVRQAYKEESVDDLISTRRCIDMMKTYLIFNKKRRVAVETCIARFNDEEIESFMSLYEALDENVEKDSGLGVEEED